jgi:thiol-disulfide isomerase/thioredoxin
MDVHSGAGDDAATLRGEVAWWRGLAAALLVAGSAVSFLLVREVRSHKADNARFEELQKQVDAVGGSLLGSRVEDLVLIDVAGVAASTSFASSPMSLIVLLSEHCPACETSAPAWAQVEAKLGGEGVPARLVVVNAALPPTDHPRWAGLAPHAVPDAGGTWLRRVPGVPAGVLVDSAGVVRRLWMRPIAGSEVDDVVQEALREVARPPG